MGEVYLAQDTSELGRTVALKILPAEVAKDKDRLQRFTQEARTVSNLNHPNILTVHEFGQTDSALFIATEYVEGVTLREHLARRRLKLIDVLDVTIQIVAALNAAHEAGVTHRDLKPENVMVRKDHIVKVLDFGLAKLSEPTNLAGGSPKPESNEAATQMLVRTEPGLVMGTVNYMSPEQSVGTGVDQRTDIWSAGVVLYEMISGSIPFPGKDIHRQIIAIQEAEPVPLAQQVEGVPERLEEIVNKCLAKDKNERYQTAKDLLIDLRNLRRKLDVNAEIERTVAPGLHSTSAGAGGTTGAQTHPASSAEYIFSGIRRHKLAMVTGLVLFVFAGVGLIFAFRHSLFPTRPARAHFQSMSITRVTTEGNVDSVTISPDGKYIAYSLEESGKRSLWTKHLGTGSRVQIVPPVESLAMNASTFSPDGGYVYYTRVDEQNPKGALYQVPVLGGVTPKKILSNVSQPVSLSPDGKQIAFGRFHLTSPEDELLVANVDGSNERSLIKVAEPDWLSGANAAWSPDGKLLATGYGSKARDPGAAAGTYTMTIGIISIVNPALKPFTSQGWPYTGNVAWFSDGTGVTFVAREHRLSPLQIWQASFPEGETRRLTNDLNSYDYYSLSLTADARALVAVQTDPVSNIWVAPDGDASRARAITSGRNVQEGHYGVMWTPDGKLVYDSDINSKASIWIVNRDGSDPKPLTDSSADDFMPEVSRDGRYIVFGSHRNGFQLWRMDLDGGNPLQLTRDTGAPTFSISPDGRWIIYSLFLGGIFKASIDGGAPTALIARGNLRYPQVSPDGKLLAYAIDDEETKRPKLAMIEFESGALVKRFDLPVTTGSSFYESAFYHGFHWSPDGRALIYINTLSGVSNLWRQPLDGSAPKQITNFKSDLIYNFAYSRDGRDLALSRGIHTRDAVLISEAK